MRRSEELRRIRGPRRARLRSSRTPRARSSTRTDSSSRAGSGVRGSGRPRTGARSRRGARARVARRPRRPSLRARRGSPRLRFAIRSRRPAASRTWATDPARTPGRMRNVWTESITQTAGRSCSRVAHTVSSSVSARISTVSAPPSRVARNETCAADSSPVTRSARRPSRAIAPSALRSSALPTPGSPPTRTREPGTSPPPSTRSSLVHAGRDALASSAETSPRGIGVAARAELAPLLEASSSSARSRTRRSQGTCRASAGSPCRTRCTRAGRDLRGHAASLGSRSDAVPRKVGRFACKMGAGR